MALGDAVVGVAPAVMRSIYDPIDEEARRLRYGTLCYRLEVRAGRVVRIIEERPPQRAWTREEAEREGRTDVEP